jgi:dinuclear metal center YbgI/SA1388 family protein
MGALIGDCVGFCNLVGKIIPMTIREIAQALETWAPLSAAEGYDNVGLLTGHPDQAVTGILVNLDATEAVVEEAIARGINLVITHHPIWFTGRKRLTGEDYVSRTLIKAIQHGIALYACHTNLDNVRDGVNHMMAQRLGLVDTQFLRAKADPTYGSGLIGQLPQAMEKSAFLQQVKDTFQCGGIRYADAPLTHVERVAVCGGAGSFLTLDALAQGAHALITADITYHKFFDQDNRMLLLDIGHYESEQYTSELIVSYLSNKFANFAVHLSAVRTNPVKYV